MFGIVTRLFEVILWKQMENNSNDYHAVPLKQRTCKLGIWAQNCVPGLSFPSSSVQVNWWRVRKKKWYLKLDIFLSTMSAFHFTELIFYLKQWNEWISCSWRNKSLWTVSCGKKSTDTGFKQILFFTLTLISCMTLEVELKALIPSFVK